MSHVDEGLLHAYLDGAFPPGNAQGEEIEAHLGVCVDCRVRLEEAREVRDRASLVLRHAAPAETHVPPFEEILARRPREPAGSRQRSVRPFWLPPLPLAWAATLILALGAGWMGRELLYRSSSSMARGTEGAALQEFGAGTPQTEQSATAVETEPGRADALRAAENFQDGRTAGRAVAGDPATPPPSVRRDGSTAPGTQRQAAPPPPPLAAAPPPAETLARKGAQDSAARGLAPERIVVTGNAAQRTRAADAAAQAGAGAAVLIRDASEVLRGDAAEAWLPVARDSRLVELLNDEFAASAAAAWAELSVADLSRPFEDAAPTITGAAHLRTEAARLDGRSLLRISYRLDDGTLLELIRRIPPQETAAGERRQTREEAVAFPAEGITLSGLSDRTQLYAGQTVLWIRRSGEDFLLRGNVSEDALRAIASRIR